MKNMAQVLNALLNGKKIVNSTNPGFLYICLYGNELCGAVEDGNLQVLQSNNYLINNPECYSLYFPYSVGDNLNEMVIVAITDNNIYLESQDGDNGLVISREEVIKHI